VRRRTQRQACWPLTENVFARSFVRAVGSYPYAATRRSRGHQNSSNSYKICTINCACKPRGRAGGRPAWRPAMVNTTLPPTDAPDIYDTCDN